MILDTSILIAAERNGRTVRQLLGRVQQTHGDVEVGLSTISVIELTHGIYRARTEGDRERRRSYAGEVFLDIAVYPVTLEIAKLAGKLEGEQAAVGNVLPFEDLIIGATALHLGWKVLTLNLRHFERIPGLSVTIF